MYRIIFALTIFFLISCEGKDKVEKVSKESSATNNNFQRIIDKYDNTYNKEPEEVLDRFMYVNGYRMAKNMQRDSLFFNLDLYIQGYVDAIKDNNKWEPKIPVSEMDSVVSAFGAYMNKKLQEVEKMKEIQTSVTQIQNLSEADSFLVVNAKQPGIITLPSKLQYKVLKEGNGPIPSSKDVVLVQITSSYIDGYVFDDTRAKGIPRVIPNEKMFSGWLEAITKMKAGSRWKIFIHPTLAFGEFGLEGKVPPNKLVILDVELIKIMTPSEVNEFLQKNPPKPQIPGGPVNGF